MKPTLFSFLQKAIQPCQVSLTERLPVHVLSPCILTSHWQLEKHPHFHLLTMQLQGDLTILCQRCLASFCFPYQHTFQLALCHDEPGLKQHITHYDCILIRELPNTLSDLLTDELHLSVPEKHPTNCTHYKDHISASD